MKSYSRSIGHTLFWLLSFFFVWAIFAGNFDNGDYYYYESEFEAGDLDRLETLGIEPLYTYLIIFLKSIHKFSGYVEFHAVISFIFMIPYWYTIRKWSQNSTITILFFAPVFLLQAIIVRNFIGFSIISLAIPLLANPKKKNLILFGLLVLFAEGFHNMMFIYLMCYLSLVDWKVFKRPNRYFAICLVIGFFAGGLLYGLLSSSSAKYNDVDDNGFNYLRMVFGVVLLINYYVLKFIKQHTSESNNKNLVQFENLILKLNLVFIGLTVVFVVSVVAARIFVNLLLFNFIFVTNRLIRPGKTGGVLPISILYFGWWIYYVVFITISVQLQDLFLYNYFILYLFT